MRSVSRASVAHPRLVEPAGAHQRASSAPPARSLQARQLAAIAVGAPAPAAGTARPPRGSAADRSSAPPRPRIGARPPRRARAPPRRRTSVSVIAAAVRRARPRGRAAAARCDDARSRPRAEPRRRLATAVPDDRIALARGASRRRIRTPARARCAGRCRRSSRPGDELAAIEVEAEVDADRPDRRSIADAEAGRRPQVGEVEVAGAREDVAGVDERRRA